MQDRQAYRVTHPYKFDDMNQTITSIDPEDLPTNTSQNEHFQAVVDRVVARRGFLKGGVGLSAAVFLGGTLAACGSDDEAVAATPLLGFSAISASTSDNTVVAAGYTATSLAAWGTPLFSTGPGSVWKGNGSETAAEQERQVGDNHDGMHFFAIDGKSNTEGLLVMNHEYNTTSSGRYTTLFGKPARAPASLDDVNKSIASWGASVIHIKKTNGKWNIVLDSPYNRRITGATSMVITGPAAGDAQMKTSGDPTGTQVLGMLNNCGNGFTPWGTYLTCEENFNNNFGTNVEPTVDTRNFAQKRYGIDANNTSYGWEKFVDRFDYKKEPNESNRFGWIVEIDPFDPTSQPKKRTALGRFKHENAAYAITKDGRVAVYMGDDQTNDYVYKFVSDAKFVPNNQRANATVLDSGKLYVAKFNDGSTSGDFMGSGEWVELSINNPLIKNYTAYTFKNQADVLIHARIAGDAVGATKMDRPEWVTVHPKTGEVYVTLTNNSGRTTADAANPRTANVYGQIVRWTEAGSDAAALTFSWDLFVLAGNPTVHTAAGNLNAGSANVNKDNLFNSPDGLGFDQFGRLWIQTDGNYSNTGNFAGMGNNQMLCADPVSKEIRRFFVGPKECEVTGIAFTPDGTSMFVNIQHPGESGVDTLTSTWPDGGSALPRSATVVITKNDGGVIGS